jgi:hypothetical protein
MWQRVPLKREDFEVVWYAVLIEHNLHDFAAAFGGLHRCFSEQRSECSKGRRIVMIRSIHRTMVMLAIALAAILLGACATTQQPSQAEFPRPPEPTSQLEIAFKERDHATGREMWLTSEMTVQSVSGPTASAASVLPCSFDIRVTEAGQSVTSPTVIASDPSMVTVSTDSRGVVTLTVTKEGQSIVTITFGRKSQKLSVWTAGEQGMFECGVTLAR